MTLLIAALLFLAPQDFPRLTGPIHDEAGAFNPEQRRLADEMIRKLEETDSTQVVMVIVPTTSGMDIADYALQTFRKNGVGQANRNNGVLIAVAVKDRRVRIEVGTGLEGRLPDALCGRIIRDEMVPHFKNGAIGAGAFAGLTAVVQSVKGEYQGKPSAGGGRRRSIIPWWLYLLFIIFMIGALHRRMGQFGGGFLLGSMLGGRGSWGGSGGSWGGGGGGGGWSGGGGFSGGGGASGSW